MSFEKLLDDLEALQKSYAKDEADEKIQAAAAEAGIDGAEDEAVDEDDEEAKAKKAAAAKKGDNDDSGDEPEGKPFGKSMTMLDPDGNEIEAVDATEFVKSLNDQVGALVKATDADRDGLTKSIEALTSIAARQGEMIKSLKADIADLANQGRGRKSTVTPAQGDMVKSEQLNASSLMAKANAAFDAGRISGKDLVVVDVALRHGSDLDPQIINRIMAP